MKIAIVTGASSGMGREAAIQIGDCFGGIEEIWLVARRKERLKALVGRIPAKIRCFGIDVTSKEQRKALEEALAAETPQVKLLVNAAGFGKPGEIGAAALESECGMIRLNCEALCAVTHIVLPYMAKNSRILQFASAAAFLPQPGFGVYAATKAFVLSYSRALGAEVKKRGIYVTAVCPGPVDTEFFESFQAADILPFYKKMVMAKPEKVVKKAIRDSMEGKPLSVYGLPMKGLWVLSKAFPHGLLIDLAQKAAQGRRKQGKDET